MQFWLIVSIFVGPIAAALLLYLALPSLRPSVTTNYGALINPARPLPDLRLVDADGKPAPLADLRGKWDLVYLGGQDCDEACERRLILIRQVRIAMGKDLSRIERVYIASDVAGLAAAKQKLEAQHPGLRFYADAGVAGQRAADFFRPADPHALYLVDPHGNWLMAYAGDVDPKGLYRDLKKLFKISVIG